MPEIMTSGQVAEVLGISRDRLAFAIRFSGAPEPKAGKVSNRRMFSPEDVEALRKWFSRRRGGVLAGTAV